MSTRRRIEYPTSLDRLPLYGRQLVTTADTDSLVVEGVNVTERVAEIETQGYTLIPDFIQANEIARIRHAFDTEVQITEMRAIGTDRG